MLHASDRLQNGLHLRGLCQIKKQSLPLKVTLLSMKRCARESRITSLIFHDFSKRDNGQKRNISLVNGLFGRKWREKIAEQQEGEYAEEDKNSEDMDIRDNICVSSFR